VTNLGDSPDLVLSLLLERWGLQRNKDLNRARNPRWYARIDGFGQQRIRRWRNDFRAEQSARHQDGFARVVDTAEYGIPYVNSPLSTRRSFIKTNRDAVLRVLRAYYEAVQETRNDKNAALKILAKYVRVDDPEILNEVYRSYGQKHLQKTIRVDLAGVRGLLKGLDKEALQFTPGSFVDASLYEELEREGFFKRSSVE
jgi:hypothetical protein